MSRDGLSIPVPRDVRFHTNGSVDWVNLSKTTLEFSYGILHRISAARITPTTLIVGQIVVQNFPLATTGYRNVQEACEALPYIQTMADILWLGFGVEGVARTLRKTSQGSSLLAICAALSECYHEDFAAEVLYWIVRKHDPPSDLTPSIDEWHALIRACAGTLSATKFPKLAEGLMRLEPGNKVVSETWGLLVKDTRDCPLAEDLAEAMIAIGKLAKGMMEGGEVGKLDSIAIFGGAAVGWLAAVAAWLFDLPLTVREISDTQGNILYSNCIDSQEPRIQFVFQRDDENRKDAVRVESRTYQLRSCLSLLHGREEPPKAGYTEFSGRLAWQDFFGVALSKLLDISLHVGCAFGCGARIFEAIAKAEPGLDDDILLYCRSYFHASSGHGLIRTILDCFPKLEDLRIHMMSGYEKPLDAAKSEYELKIAAIKRHCPCSRCKGGEEFDLNEGKQFCLLAVFETILVLCRILSGVTVITEGLLPMSAGMEKLYLKQLSRRSRSTAFDKTHKITMGPIVYVIEAGPWTGNENRIVEALQLFTGRVIHNIPAATTALCENGICAYLDILTEFSLDCECVGRVNIVPGRIEKDHAPYRALVDREELVNSHSVLSHWELSFLKTWRFDDVSVLLTESLQSLNISFQFCEKGRRKVGPSTQIGPAYVVTSVSQARSPVSPCIEIGPAYLVKTILQARSLVSCSDRKNHRILDAQGAFQTSDPVLKCTEGGATVYGIDCRGYDYHFLAVALVLATKKFSCQHACLICEDECLQCFLQYAFKKEMQAILFATSSPDEE